MTIKSSGIISMSDISVELAFNANAVKSLNDSDVRTLLNKSSGIISLSDAYGKTKPITGNVLGVSYTSDGASYGWPGAYTENYNVVGPNPTSISGSLGILYYLFYIASISQFSVMSNFPASSFNIVINGVNWNFGSQWFDGSYYYYISNNTGNSNMSPGSTFTVTF